MNKNNLKTLSTRLGLSISTISKALRDSYEISEETKKKVLSEAKKIGYQPNPYAGFLRNHKSKTIGLIIPNITNSFFIQAIKGVEEIASQKKYHVLIYHTHESEQEEQRILQELTNGRVDGLLISLVINTNIKNYIKELHKYEIPIVFFDRIYTDINTPKITSNNQQATFNATKLLIQKGCKHIAFLMVSENSYIMQERKLGYMNACQKYGIHTHEDLMLKCNTPPDTNVDIIKSFLEQNFITKPDAIFATVEQLALDTYRACRELGIQIPQDIKVISFANLEMANLLNPALTTIRQPAYEVGKQSAQALFNCIQKKTISQEKVIIPSEIIMGDSTQ